MSFKIHLIIISGIIVAVYLAWYWMMAPDSASSVPQTAEKSIYSISISRASWGLNCKYRAVDTMASESSAFANTDRSPALREDNVLLAVSQRCNGQLRCEIPLTPQALGGDPAPDCAMKELVVEYRCFSYDRPWIAKSSSSTLVIDCTKAMQ